MSTTLPSPRADTSAVWDGENAYIFGGRRMNVASNEIVRFNPATNAVTLMNATLPTARKATSAIWDGHHAYVFGGNNQILRYDPATDKLTVMAAKLPTAREYTSAIWDGRNAYIFGGVSSGVLLKQIVRFNISTDTVAVLAATLPSARDGTSAIWDGQAAYIFGGSPGGATPFSEIVRFDTTTGLVTMMNATLPGVGLTLTSAVWDGYHAYVFGGSYGNSGLSSAILKFDPVSDTMNRSDATLPSRRTETSAVWSTGNAHIFGGRGDAGDNEGYHNQIVRFTRPPASPPREFSVVPGPGPGSLSLSWLAPSSHAGPVLEYRLYRGLTNGTETLLDGGECADVDALNCTDIGLPNDVTRYYRIRAVTPVGEGELSTTIHATTFGPPAAPQALTASSDPLSPGIRLEWEPPIPNPPRDGGFPIEAYNIYRGSSSGNEWFLSRIPNITSYIDYPCGGVAQYSYTVTAISISGEGPRAPPVEATSTNVTPETIELCVDEFDLSKYRPEALTGETPFGGATIKPITRGTSKLGSVNLANGELLMQFNLLSSASPLNDEEPPVELTYRSIGNAEGSPALAPRWSLSVEQSIVPIEDDLLLHTGDGRNFRFERNLDVWEGPPGSYARIERTDNELELQDREGRRSFFDGTSGTLTKSLDSTGNAWTYLHDEGQVISITDPFGRATTFTYNGPVLARIENAWGQAAHLSYEPTGERIASIRTTDAGNSANARFEYSTDGQMASITDAKGQTYLQIEYDSFGRVKRQITGDAGVHDFHYNFTSGITKNFDPANNENEWRFVHAGDEGPRVVPSAQIQHTRGLRAGDPASYVTGYEYNAQDELTKTTFPRGNVLRRIYDENSPSFFSRGNLLTETRSPGSAGSEDPIVTSYTYDPACNKPTQIADPRGNDATFTPPNGGASSALRYAVGITYSTACLPVMVKHPNVNPAGVPNPAFTSAYADQVIEESFEYDGLGRLVAHVDPAGVSEVRTYYESPSTPGKPAGFLKSVTRDPGPSPHLDLTTTYEYSDLGFVNKIIDPNGNIRTFEVDTRGRVIEEIGPALGSAASIHTQRVFNSNDELIELRRETEAGSGVYTQSEFAYDALGRMVTETRHPSPSDSLTTTYRYDGNGNLIERIGGAGETQRWSYDERNLLLSMSGPDGGTYDYDANGNRRTSTDHLGHSTSYEYDGFDRLAVRTDPRMSKFVTSYDPVGNIIMDKGIGGSNGVVLYETTYAHDEANRAYQRQEWQQSALTMPPAEANALGPDGRWVASLTEFDARGQATRLINDNANVTTMLYDAASRRVGVTEPSGNFVLSTYDKNGNVVEEKRVVAGAMTSICPDVCRTVLAYDAEDRLMRVTNPDGSSRETAYDGRGNAKRSQDENGQVVLYTYDGADRLVSTRRALGTGPATYVTTTTEWDDEDRVSRVCDDLNACTTYTYVPATDLVATETPPTGPSVASTHDAAGNVRVVSYSSGRTVSLGYDALDRLTSVDLAASRGVQGTSHQDYTYDDMGRITQATDNGASNLGGGLATTLAHVAAVQEFDTLGRVITESQLGLPVKHTYDGVGNVLSTTYPSLDGRVVSRSFDANERLDRVWDSKGLLADYAFLGHQVLRKEFGGPTPAPPPTGATSPAVRSVLTYDDAQRPVGVRHEDAAGALRADLTTRFDAVGNRAAQKLQASGASGDKHSQLYGLDPLYRTISWSRGPISDSSPSSPLDTIASPIQQASWPDIDGQNDWITWSDGSGTCTRTTGSAGATPIRQVIDSCGPDVTTYDYDADGNMASDGTYTYHWDLLNRLIRVDDSSGNAIVGYGYDAFARRVIKVFPNSVAPLPGVQADGEAWYTFAGQHVVQESQPIGSVLPVTVPPTAPNVHVIRQWIYGPGIDEALVMDVDSDQSGVSAIDATDTRYFYVYDSGGSVLGLASGTGHLVEGYAYEPYGAVTILTPGNGATDVKWDGTDAISTGTYGTDPTPRPYSPSGNLWFFTGRQYDPEVGLYNYRARHYHPELGQFMSLDPIGAWGDPMNLGNPYAYVGNNPGSWTDPSGHCPWCLAGGIVGSAVGALWQTGSYAYEVARTGSPWNHQDAAARIKFGLIAGAAIGATGGAGASVTAAVSASGAGAAAIIGTTVGVGAAEGVIGQAAMELLTDGQLSGDARTYASSAAFGAVTAGAGYAIGAAWKAPGFGQKVGVIGEYTDGRVVPYAEELAARGYQPVVYRPRPGLSEAESLADNRAWVRGLKAEGCPIFDCGPMPGRANFPGPTSPWYKMELDEMQGYSKYRREWRP